MISLGRHALHLTQCSKASLPRLACLVNVQHVKASRPVSFSRVTWAGASAATSAGDGSSTITSNPKDVPTPLSMRPPAFEAPVTAVLSWYEAMAARVDEIGDKFEQQDLGPSGSELMRELGWVLDDTIVAIRYQPDDPWVPCTWRYLELEVGAAVRSGRDMKPWALQTRASVDQLYEWWRLRLEERMPFQYLIASAHWRQHVLSVGPGVLIPRPETEIFADLVSNALSLRPGLARLPWVDLGTGSGAIAITAAEALRKYNKDARVLAVDLSPVAAAYAAANVRATGLSAHVDVLQGSWFQPVAAAILGLQQGGGEHGGADGGLASDADGSAEGAKRALLAMRRRWGID